MNSFSGEIAGTADWCPLMGGVRLREVSVSGGSTVNSLLKTALKPKKEHLLSKRRDLENDFMMKQEAPSSLYSCACVHGASCTTRKPVILLCIIYT